MARGLISAAVIAALACVVTCGVSQPASGLRPAPSAPPAGELLSQSQSSNLNDFHIRFTAHLWAEGPLSRLNGSITVRFSGAGSVVVGPR